MVCSLVLAFGFVWGAAADQSVDAGVDAQGGADQGGADGSVDADLDAPDTQAATNPDAEARGPESADADEVRRRSRRDRSERVRSERVRSERVRYHPDLKVPEIFRSPAARETGGRVDRRRRVRPAAGARSALKIPDLFRTPGQTSTRTSPGRPSQTDRSGSELKIPDIFR